MNSPLPLPTATKSATASDAFRHDSTATPADDGAFSAVLNGLAGQHDTLRKGEKSHPVSVEKHETAKQAEQRSSRRTVTYEVPEREPGQASAAVDDDIHDRKSADKSDDSGTPAGGVPQTPSTDGQATAPTDPAALITSILNGERSAQDSTKSDRRAIPSEPPLAGLSHRAASTGSARTSTVASAQKPAAAQESSIASGEVSDVVDTMAAAAPSADNAGAEPLPGAEPKPLAIVAVVSRETHFAPIAPGLAAHRQASTAAPQQSDPVRHPIASASKPAQEIELSAEQANAQTQASRPQTETQPNLPQAKTAQTQAHAQQRTNAQRQPNVPQRANAQQPYASPSSAASAVPAPEPTAETRATLTSEAVVTPLREDGSETPARTHAQRTDAGPRASEASLDARVGGSRSSARREHERTAAAGDDKAAIPVSEHAAGQAGATTLAATSSSAVPGLPAATLQQLADTVAAESSRLATAPQGTSLSGSSAGPVRFLEIQLHPADLGVVTVRLRFSNGEIGISMRASKPETARLLDQDRASLDQALTTAGCKSSDLTVITGAQPAVSPLGAEARTVSHAARGREEQQAGSQSDDSATGQDQQRKNDREDAPGRRRGGGNRF